MVRYLLQQPEKLESLAIDKLGHYIALQAEKLVAPITELRDRDAAKAEALLSQQIEIIRTRLNSNVPRMLSDKLLQKTIRALTETDRSSRCPENLYLRDSQTYVFERMVETIFINNLTFISLRYNMYVPSLCSKSYMLTGLIQLHLFETNIKESDAIQLLKELHNLKKLSLNYCSYTDNILRCIAENCKLIEKLNLHHTCIMDNSIDILTQLCNLRSVDLQETGVTQSGIEILLMSCPNIEYIGTRFIAHALEHIASLKENSGRQFKLKSFVNDLDTTLEQLELLVQMCPLIQNITFDHLPPSGAHCFGRDPAHYRYKLMVINDLKDLRQLTLRNYDFYRDNIKEVLEAKGHNLVELVLEAHEIDLNALKCIIRTCPNLESLSINFMFRYEERNIFSVLQSLYKRSCTGLFYIERKTKQIENPHFKDVKSLSLNMTPWSEAHKQYLIFLLSSCPNIEFISTGVFVSLTDDIMLKVLDKNPLTCLKELKMWESQLSMAFMDRIVQNCINPPVVELYV